MPTFVCDSSLREVVEKYQVTGDAEAPGRGYSHPESRSSKDPGLPVHTGAEGPSGAS